jgi:hypothetical protein
MKRIHKNNEENPPNLLSEDLDTSWIETEEKLYSTEMNLSKTPMESILCYFIYVGADLSIQKIIKDSESIVSLDNLQQGITSNRILQIIQTRRFLGNGLKYKVMSLLKYFVDLEPNSLQDYCYGEHSYDVSKGFFREISFLEDIVIQPSIFLFHSLNSLYFLFKEYDTTKKNVKPILKTDSNGGDISSRITKKVRISDEPKVSIKQYHKSLKYRPSSFRKTRKMVDDTISDHLSII